MNNQTSINNRTLPFIIAVLTLILSLGSFLSPISHAQDNRKPQKYEKGPDSNRKEGVPRGEITEHQWLKSNIYPGTVRRYYTYVPKQYDASKPAALMVFMDGHAYVSETGDFRVPVVFDNLIHSGEMPVTIGVFVDPGHKKDKLPPKPGWRPQPENRANEYDTLSDAYARFITTEILPQVTKQYNITDDPELRATCGSSSGGICAFTLAWEMPNQFRRVISHIGSFVNIRGGDVYPGIIRKAKKRPIKVFLQEGTNDLDNEHGNWPLANQQMLAALKFRDYNVKMVMGDGAHNGNHGGAIFPDTVRWLFEDIDFEGKKPKSIIPEVQTASWAVKWWQPRHDQKLKEKAEMKQVDLLFVGDSITHGWENSGKATFDKYYAQRNTLNIGFSGDRTENVIWRLQNGAIDDIAPKACVIMIGTNNTGHRQDKPEDTAAGVRAIIEEIKTKTPKTKILLLGIFPRGATPDDNLRKINVATNEILKTMASDDNIWFLDISDKFVDEKGNLPKSIMPDMLHPNGKGYEIWAEAMEEQVAALLGEK